MTEGTTMGEPETVIKIDGVEYGVCVHQTAESPCDCTEDERCPDNHFQVGHTCYAPKRVRTGRICHKCGPDPCVVIGDGVMAAPCACGGSGTVFETTPYWRPFYGKVVE